MTDKGYKRRTYDEIVKGKIARAKEFFGEDMDTSELSWLGKEIRIHAFDQSYLEELAEEIYYSRFPTTANGMNIDKLMPFAAVSRNTPEASVYSIEITGTPGYFVSKGFLVGNDAGLIFSTTERVEIGANGKVTVPARCTLPGTMGNTNYTSINIIINPNADIVSAIGVGRISAGVDMEGDYSARSRMLKAIQGAGSTNENAVRAALLRIPTVQSAGIIVNDGDIPDEKGRPPHSFECFLTGGESYHEEIAETIFNKKPLGIKTHGNIIITIKDSGGYDKEIKFSHSTPLKVIVKIKIRKALTFEASGEQEIATKLQQYIDELGLARELVFSSLYGYIYAVQGVEEVTELQISVDGGTMYSTNNIIPEDWEIVQFERADIAYA